MKRIAVTSEMEYVGNPQMTRSYINHDYPNYVLRAGCFPISVTCEMNVEDIADECDGLLLTGGKDISPLLYGDDLEWRGAQKCNLVRDIFERNLYEAFLKRAKPIFGICRGFQMIGIQLGWKLDQDILKHNNVHIAHNQNDNEITGENPVHIMTSRGIVRDIIGIEHLPVNSFHHQGFVCNHKLGYLNQGDEVLGWARSRDKMKIMEAVAVHLKSDPDGQRDTIVAGVQYHPERMMRRKKDRNRHLALFRWTMGLLNDPDGYDVFKANEQENQEQEDTTPIVWS